MTDVSNRRLVRPHPAVTIRPVRRTQLRYLSR